MSILSGLGSHEPERLGEDMGHGAHNGSGAGYDCSVLEEPADDLPDPHEDRFERF